MGQAARPSARVLPKAGVSSVPGAPAVQPGYQRALRGRAVLGGRLAPAERPHAPPGHGRCGVQAPRRPGQRRGDRRLRRLRCRRGHRDRSARQGAWGSRRPRGALPPQSTRRGPRSQRPGCPNAGGPGRNAARYRRLRRHVRGRDGLRRLPGSRYHRHRSPHDGRDPHPGMRADKPQAPRLHLSLPRPDGRGDGLQAVRSALSGAEYAVALSPAGPRGAGDCRRHGSADRRE